MTVQELKDIVVEANKELPKRHMVLYSWGNVSAIDREKGIIVIKPVGIPYDDLTTENVSVVDLQGKKVSGEKNPLNPSVDLDIHRALYENVMQLYIRTLPMQRLWHSFTEMFHVLERLMQTILQEQFPVWMLFRMKKLFRTTNGIQAWRL